MQKTNSNDKQTLTENIKRQILESHVLRHQRGERIPTEKELSSQYKASVTTIRRAVSALETQGKVERRHGSGTFVIDGSVNYNVALLVPEIAYGDFYQRMACSLEQKLLTHGIDSRVYASDAGRFQFNKVRSSLRKHDAVILCGYGATAEELADIGKPYLVVGCETSEEAPYIGLDFLSIMRQSVKYLLNTGCKNIRLLLHSPRPDDNTGSPQDMSMRIFSFRMALQEYGIPFKEDLIQQVGSTVLDYRASSEKIFDQYPSDAFICSNDLLAMTVCQLLRERKISVPDKVSVIGCNNLIPVEQQEIPLSTIDFCFDELARQTSRMLDELLQHSPSGQITSCFIRPKLIVRKTTKPFSR